jgi:signal peptidase II
VKHWLWLSFTVLLLDQASKWLVLAALEPFEAVPVLPHFNFTLMFNEGAAFSFLAGAGGWQRWLLAALAIVVAGALIGWLLKLRPDERLQASGLALLIGGAIGNLIDRVFLGHVVDFIQVYLPFMPWPIFNPWPAFNVADSAITLGIGILIFTIVFADEAREPADSSRPR